MNPWQLAKTSESSQQVALFCFLAKAQSVGFGIAKQQDAYKLNYGIPDDPAIPELKWLHHIPNGGTRGDNATSRAIAGGQLKAEGVKSGVHDLCWPLSRGAFCGLYIEMKKPAEQNTKTGGLSDNQVAFGDFVYSQGYFVRACYSWLEAAETIEWYYKL